MSVNFGINFIISSCMNNTEKIQLLAVLWMVEKLTSVRVANNIERFRISNCWDASEKKDSFLA